AGGGAMTADACLGCGTMRRGAGGGSVAGLAGVGALATGGAGAAAAGLVSTGVGTGGAGLATGGCAAACCFCVLSLRTSPGLEICERSILVLISSSPRAAREAREPAEEASARDLKTARTFSASWSSRELECVFFSVTPASGRTSRIALLLTSSSLARSLIRILLIRRIFPPPCPAKPSCQPHEWVSYAASFHGPNAAIHFFLFLPKQLPHLFLRRLLRLELLNLKRLRFRLPLRLRPGLPQFLQSRRDRRRRLLPLPLLRLLLLLRRLLRLRPFHPQPFRPQPLHPR